MIWIILKKILINENNSHEIIKNSNENTQNKRKKNKVLTLNESRRKLSLRAVVMNKNFFRALRREIKFIFKNYLISNRFSTSKCKRTFKINLRRFWDYLIMNSSDYDKKLGGKF